MIERYLLKKAETLLMPVVEQESQGIAVSEEAKRRVAVFYSYAFLGVLMEWISKGMTASPHEIVMMVSAIILGDFRNSILSIKASCSVFEQGAFFVNRKRTGCPLK